MSEQPSSLKRALDLSCNKFVQACAGAGKTFALSKRYCAILDDFARQWLESNQNIKLGVENILVITFTRKAAAEMAERIYRDLNRLLEGGILDDLEAGMTSGENLLKVTPEYRMRLRANFSNNYIQTIDSFCARILREFAYLTDSDPNFELEEEYQTEQDFKEALDVFLKKRSRASDVDLQMLFNFANLKTIKEFFHYLYVKKSLLGDWFDRFQTLSNNEIREQWKMKYTPDFDTHWFDNEIRKLTDYLKCSFKDAQDNGVQFLQSIEVDYKSLDHTCSDCEKRWEIVNQILPRFLTTEGEYRTKVPGNRANWIPPSRCEEYKENFNDFITKLRIEIPLPKIAGAPSENDFRSIPALKALARLFLEFEEEFSSKRRAQSRYSFDEVIIGAYNLLRNHSLVRFTLSQRFKHILIDEFQDTNDLRWEIIKLLISGEDGSVRKQGIFIVGDKKQSIYGFNQAEVEVMEHAQSTLIKSGTNPQDILIDFNLNFRSSRNYIASVINPLFSKIMPSEEKAETLPPYEAFFSPTEYGVKTDDSEKERLRITENTPVSLIIQATTREKDEDSFYVPAYHTALVVKEFLEWGERCGIKETPVIAVLMRKFTKIGHYFRAFQALEIPFEVAGGKELFQQQEAFDLFHLLSVLINPDDDLALVGLLRGPLFSLSDSEIQQASTEGFKNQKMVISAWRKLAKTLPLDRLLRKILQVTEAEFGYFSEVAGPQRISNIDRLISFIHSLSLQGKSLREVFDHFKFIMEKVEEIPQAELPSSAKVQIMTIHKAKGLQFPAVIIPEMQSAVQSDIAHILHGKINGQHTEIGISLEDEEGVSVKTGLLKALKDLNKRKAQAEETRLFYVAVTRAKYRCALLADFKENSRNARHWWQRFIQDTGFSEEYCRYLSSEDFRSLLHHYSVHQIPTIEWSEPPKFEKFKRFWEVDTHDIVNSVHPYKDNGRKDSRFNPQEKALVGTLFHQAVEKGIVDSLGLRGLFERVLQDENSELKRKEIIDETLELLEKYWHSEVSLTLSNIAPKNLFREHPIRGWIDNGDLFLEVSGRIDALYHKDGRWRALDFKTDSDTSRLPAYRIQIQTYLWCLKQAYNIEAIGEIYFVNSGQLFPVFWDDDYFSSIYPSEKSAFGFSRLNSSYNPPVLAKIEDLIKRFPDEQIVILNQTKQQAHDLYKALVSREKLLRPNISFTTLDEMIISFETIGKRVSPELAEIMIEKILSEKKVIPSFGFSKTLTQAVLDAEEWGGGLVEKYSEIAREFLELKKAKGWLTTADIISSLSQSGDFGQRIYILNGFYEFNPQRINLIKKISREAKQFFFIDNLENDKVFLSFDYENSIWERKAEVLSQSHHICQTCFSVEEEVEAVAWDILALPDWQNKLDDIKVVVTSTERYVPLIKRVFSDFNIPTRIFKNEPVLERPVVQFILGLLDIMEEAPKWEWGTVAKVLLHPLMEPDDELIKFDQWLRQKGNPFYNLDKDI
jgi:ATP-dependent exoDNAse (exonuclease V) beta subunit